jgi:hypothetical protein
MVTKQILTVVEEGVLSVMIVYSVGETRIAIGALVMKEFVSSHLVRMGLKMVVKPILIVGEIVSFVRHHNHV